jgi:hypothetical protein
MALIFLTCQESAYDVPAVSDSRLHVPRWQDIQWHEIVITKLSQLLSITVTSISELRKEMYKYSAH